MDRQESFVTKGLAGLFWLPITPITAKQSREIDKRNHKRRERLRQRYPEVHGRAVDYISHSIEDGTLFFSVAFKDKTLFSEA